MMPYVSVLEICTEKFILPIQIGIKHFDLPEMIDQTVTIMTKALIIDTVAGSVNPCSSICLLIYLFVVD